MNGGDGALMGVADKKHSGDDDFLPDMRVFYGMPEGHDARMLADRARLLAAQDRVLVHVALDDARMALLADMLAFFAPDVRVICFPAWDCLPYDRVSPHNEIVAQRVAALAGALAWQSETKRYPRIFLTSVNAASQRVMPRESLEKAVLQAVKGGRLESGQLQSFMQHNGYVRTETVREPGEYAIRGGIVDLFPPGCDEPVRIDLFGDEIESVRSFDPVTQMTTGQRDGLTLHPATEFLLDDDSIARFRTAYRDLFGVVRGDDPLYEAVSTGRRYSGMDHWLPLFFDKMETLADYIPGACYTVDPHGTQAVRERIAQVEDFYQARRTMQESQAKAKKESTATLYHPLPPAQLYCDYQEWCGAPDADVVILSPFGIPDGAVAGCEDGKGRKGHDFAAIRALPDGDVFASLRDHINALRADDPARKIMIAAYSHGSAARLKALMESAGITPLASCGAMDDVKKLKPGQTGIAVLALEQGFVSPDLAVMTEQDILGDRLSRTTKKRKKAGNFLKEVSSLAPGDLVVHVDHGVGRFDALVTLEAAGKLHDCLKIVYAGDDRLFVPVENIDVLSRFGSDEGTVPLDKLGGAGWQARKARVKKDLMIIADKLLKLAARRLLQKADKMEIGSALYQEFAARFPYHETDDQLRAIEAVTDDMAQAHPMDRLVCGDVGFGKTEIAIRAAYIAAMSGAQVALVVPTTLLARQHYNNFAARFKGTGIRIAQLSRLVPAREAAKVREGLADGSVNIVIGTHALFAKNIRFAHLGLLIVDEEQRFGVKQKERLKELKSSVHVLTLTATPIPRTLQMALTGVRDLSLIATPPVDRLAIRTFVLPYDPVVIREALLREHYRGGQSFYVVPRISDLEMIEERLRELVPEIKFITAHGQMPPQELEDRMSAFYDGQYQVLVATNIIESGLDIPSANTMIIHRADMFGLSQLYQIRGRIGRSKVRAYAYLTYSPGKILTQQGQKRLEVIETLDSLGAGFQLASHDMDIRGAGNLLGEEQSGHIREVGVELYQQMLEEAVALAREGLDYDSAPDSGTWSPQINVGTSVLIPDHYVEDLSLRMSLYRRLSELEQGDDVDSFAAELIDRFGDLPEEVVNLLDIVTIRQFCRKAGIGSVEAGPKGAVIGFHKNNPPDVTALMGWIAEKGGAIKLRPDQKIVAIRQWINVEQRVRGVKSLVQELAGLVRS